MKAVAVMTRKTAILIVRRTPKRVWKRASHVGIRYTVRTVPVTAITMMEPHPISSSPRGSP